VEEKLNFVDKKLVHKVRDENVHIYNMRRALPREIDVTTFEVDILPNLTGEEEKFVLNFYVKRIHSSTSFFICSKVNLGISRIASDLIVP
jgi:hypothetical protein